MPSCVGLPSTSGHWGAGWKIPWKDPTTLLTVCSPTNSHLFIAATELHQITPPVADASAGRWPRADLAVSLCPEFIDSWGSNRASRSPALISPWEALARCLPSPYFSSLLLVPAGVPFSGAFRVVLRLALWQLPRQVGGSALLCATWCLEALKASAAPDVPSTPLPLTGMSLDMEGETEPPEFSCLRRRAPCFSWSLLPVHQALTGCDFTWGFRRQIVL